MIHPNTILKFVNSQIGNGVFATALIPRGTIVYVKDALEVVVSPAQYDTMDMQYRKILDIYSYRDERGDRILSWDHAKYVNHRCDCNTMSTGYGFEIAIRDILPGEEITDEYGLFNLEEPMEVACGCPDCRKVIYPDDIETYHAHWDERVRAALQRVHHVEQPLLPFLEPAIREELESCRLGRKGHPSVRELSCLHPAI